MLAVMAMRRLSANCAWPKKTRESDCPEPGPHRERDGEADDRQQDHVGVRLRGEVEPVEQQDEGKEPRAQRHVPAQMRLGRREQLLGRHGMGAVVHAQHRAPDAKARVAAQRQARHALGAVLGVEAIERSQVLGHQFAVLAAGDPEVVRGHVRIVHHHVVVERAPHARLGGVDAVARGHVAVARQHLDPHHCGHWIASRKRRPSATALAWDTPCMVSVAMRASRSRSCVRAMSVTL